MKFVIHPIIVIAILFGFLNIQYNFSFNLLKFNLCENYYF